MQTTGFTNYTEFSYLDGDKRGAVIDILTRGLYEQTRLHVGTWSTHFRKRPIRMGAFPGELSPFRSVEQLPEQCYHPYDPSEQLSQLVSIINQARQEASLPDQHQHCSLLWDNHVCSRL